MIVMNREVLVIFVVAKIDFDLFIFITMTSTTILLNSHTNKCDHVYNLVDKYRTCGLFEQILSLGLQNNLLKTKNSSIK